MDTWHDRAKTRLKDLGQTQDWLAEEFQMTPGGMQKWLAGTRQPSLDEINKIADKLECPRTWLTHGVDPDDSVDGLPSGSRGVLRRLIHLERAKPLPGTFWNAIEMLTQTVTPPPPPADIKSEDAPRNGTEG